MARLTIPDEQTYATFTATAQTVFPITFALISGKPDLRLSVDGVERAQSTFTFSGTLLDGGGYQGGTVVSNSALTGAVVIWRDVSPERASQFAPSNTVPVRSVDMALNRSMAISQDAKRDLSRALLVELGDEPVSSQGVIDAARAVANKAEKTYVQDVVVDVTLPPYNAVADFNGATGTDDSAAYLAAGATGRQPDMPEGDYFFSQSTAHRLFERIGSTGPGRFWLNFFGSILAAGKTFPIGRLVSRLGSDLMGGILLGAEAFGRGVRLAATRISGPVIIPSDWSYLEWNMYARLPTGKVRRGSGTNKLTYIGGFNLNVAGDLVQPDDLIFVGHTPYLIVALESDGFTVKNVDGSSVSFGDNTAYVYRWCYDVSKGICDVSGTSVSWVRGEEFFPFSYGSEAHDIQFNGGAWRNVSSITSNEALTLATSAGTLTGASFVLKTRMDIACVLRCQSVFGAIEENLMLGVMANGHALLDLQGLADSDVQRTMGFGIAGAQRFDGNADREHFKMTASGKVGVGLSRETLEASDTHLTIGGNGPTGYLGWSAYVDKGDGAGYVRTRFLISAPNAGGTGFRTLLLPN